MNTISAARRVKNLVRRRELRIGMTCGTICLQLVQYGVGWSYGAAPSGKAVLLTMAPGRDATGKGGLLLTFDRAPPLYSIEGDGSARPALAFAAAITAKPMVEVDAKDVATAVTTQNDGAVLTIAFSEPGPTHLIVTSAGDRSVFVKPAGRGAGVAPPSGAALRTEAPSSYTEHEEGGFEVVPLRYADVSEIVGLLTADQTVKPNGAFVPEEPNFGSGLISPAGPGFSATAPPVGAGAPSADVAAQPLGQSIDETIGIDRRLNAVIIKGSSARLASLREKIAKLDVPVTSVLLETVFVELTESAAHNVGLDLNNTNQQIASLGYAAGPSLNGGELRSYGTASLQAAIYAQVIQGQGRILSKPRIAAQSGGTAKIVTGDAVPILTSIALSGVNAVSQQVQYVTVGVSLQIAPRVSDDGFVTSHVFCEVSSVTGYSQGYPTISQREASTSATVHDGDSFIIGGLTQENTLTSDAKIPGAGDLPLIGKLLHTHKATGAKTNLYIVVTPHIARNGTFAGIAPPPP